MAHDPLANLPPVAEFSVTSDDVTNGEAWAPPQTSAMLGMPGGEDRSPQLSWSGAPEGTKSYAVTIYDPDAPTQSGFWHWAVINIPASVTSLPSGISPDGDGLPDGAVQLASEVGAQQYVGAGPPPGHGPHEYWVVVHALDIDHVDLAPTSTPAVMMFTTRPNVIGRAVLVATAER